MKQFFLFFITLYSVSGSASSLNEKFVDGRALASKLVARLQISELPPKTPLAVVEFLTGQYLKLSQDISTSSHEWITGAAPALCAQTDPAPGARIRLHASACANVSSPVDAVWVLIRQSLRHLKFDDAVLAPSAVNAILHSWALVPAGYEGFRYDPASRACVNGNGEKGTNSGWLGECGANVGKDFSHLDLSRRLLRGADFKLAELFRTVLTEANLRDANFSAAKLSHAILNGGNFSGAYFQSADLHHARAIGARFQNADFRNASLTDMCLRAADLSGAKLQGANFRIAVTGDNSEWTKSATACPNNWYLNGTGWEPRSLAGAEYDSKTLLPFNEEEAKTKWGMVFRAE